MDTLGTYFGDRSIGFVVLNKGDGRKGRIKHGFQVVSIEQFGGLMTTHAGTKKMRDSIEYMWLQEFGLGQSKLKMHVTLTDGFMSLSFRGEIRARDSDLVVSVI